MSVFTPEERQKMEEARKEASATQKASCLREGVYISDLLAIVKVAGMEGDEPTVNEAIKGMKEVVEFSDCLGEAMKSKVGNEIDALKGFTLRKDKEGIRQAVKALRDDIATPISVKLAQPGAGPRIKGYQLRIDGRPVGKPLSRKEAPESFEAALALHPEAKVELEPVTQAQQ